MNAKLNLQEKPYVQLQILPQPWKFYTIPDGVHGDIFQVCNFVDRMPFFRDPSLIWVFKGKLTVLFLAPGGFNLIGSNLI